MKRSGPGARVAAAALLAGVGLVLAQPAGCSCNGNGHVERTPVVVKPGDNIVNCACNLTFDYDKCDNGICFAHFEVELCLPPELRLPPDTDAGFATADGGVESYARRIDEYCERDISNVGYHLITVFNGNWCGYKAAWAPDGGRGDSVVCFAHQVGPNTLSATRYEEAACPGACPVIKCEGKNCLENVQDATGNIHIENCRCSRVEDQVYGCPGDPPSDIPTVVFCRPRQALPPQ